MNKPLVIAHRGASFYEPENSISAVKKALELRSDMIEVDVRITKDNEIIVIHDAIVDRTTDGTGYIKYMELRDIKKLRINKKEKIPTLQEIIDLIKGKCKLNIEIKEYKAVDKILKIIKDNNINDEVLISSFNEKILKHIKEKDSRIKTGYLFRRPTPFYINIAKRSKIDYIHPYYPVITKRLINRAHKNGIKVNVWTIKNRESALKAKEIGVDGLITNDPLLYK